MQQRFSGVTVTRIIDPSDAEVPEHAHEWPVLSLFVMGAYLNRTDAGERLISVPSAVLYRAGAAHRNTVGPEGFEQIEIEFDPRWLGQVRLPDAPVVSWVGGSAGASARALALQCGGDMSEQALLDAVRQFVQRNAPPSHNPGASWQDPTSRRLRDDTSLTVAELAKAADRHPSWFGTAYRMIIGEGVRGTAARLRVERASRLLRETDTNFCRIALAVGFCDQSHMNRTFQRVLGRSPSTVRSERTNMRRL